MSVVYLQKISSMRHTTKIIEVSNSPPPPKKIYIYSNSVNLTLKKALECLEITPQNNQVLRWTPKLSAVSSLPPSPSPPPPPPPPPPAKKKIKYWNSKFEPLKWPKSTSIWRYKSTLPHNPLGLHPLPRLSAAFCWLSFGWHQEVMNPIYYSTEEIYYLSPDRTSAFCDRSRNFLSVAYTVQIRFVVINPLLSP